MPTSPEIIQFQQELAEILTQYFSGSLPIEIEWRAEFRSGLYSPRMDLAVGPFAIAEGERYIGEYNQMMHAYSNLILGFIEIHLNNTGQGYPPKRTFDLLYRTNPNARCFMAIEIEKSGSRKHLMGDAVNAAALGRIGIVVGWTAEMFQTFLNLKSYFAYLEDVKKNTFNLSNLLILDPDQLRDAIIGVL